MAKLIKIAGNTNPIIKLSSTEWLRTGLSYNMLYKDDKGLIKVAQAGGKYSAADLAIQHALKNADPALIAQLAMPTKRAPKGFKIISLPGGLFGVENISSKSQLTPTRVIVALRSVVNPAYAASHGGALPPIPKPAPVPKPRPVPKPTPKPGMSWGKGLGMAGAGLAGGAAGYYGTGAIADAMRDSNQLTKYDPDNFYRGVASFQTAMSPILGISKVLAKETKEIMATIAELQQQMTANDPGTRSPSMMKKDEVEQAMTSANAPPASGVSYLPN